MLVQWYVEWRRPGGAIGEWYYWLHLLAHFDNGQQPGGSVCYPSALTLAYPEAWFLNSQSTQSDAPCMWWVLSVLSPEHGAESPAHQTASTQNWLASPLHVEVRNNTHLTICSGVSSPTKDIHWDNRLDRQKLQGKEKTLSVSQQPRESSVLRPHCFWHPGEPAQGSAEDGSLPTVSCCAYWGVIIPDWKIYNSATIQILRNTLTENHWAKGNTTGEVSMLALRRKEISLQCADKSVLDIYCVQSAQSTTGKTQASWRKFSSGP